MKLAAHLNSYFKLFFTLGVLGTAPYIKAKNLAGHWGLGASNVGPGFSAPQISGEWQMSRASALELLFGLDTLSSSNSLSLGARYQRHLFLEDSLYYSVYLGGGILSTTTATTSSSGFYFESGGMASFFLNGLPNLALQLGSGVRLESPGGSRIRSVFFGGFHYYF